MANKPRLRPIVFENATIAFRNFSGKEGQYNQEGDRNFHLFLNPDVAEAMLADGWNVKYLKPRDEGDPPQAHVEVAVSYRFKPPKIVLITDRGRTELSENELNILDWADIRNADLILNPSTWGPINGRSGIKAYLAKAYIAIEEDALEAKYEDGPDSAQKCVGPDCPIEDNPPWS